MIRIVIITITINFLFITTSFAAQNLVKTPNFKPESLEDLTNDLLKQKEQMDPFSTNNVKVDLESLGLDNVDNSNEVKTEKQVNQNLIEPKIEEVKKLEPSQLKDASNISIQNKEASVIDKKEDKNIPIPIPVQESKTQQNFVVKDLENQKSFPKNKSLDNNKVQTQTNIENPNVSDQIKAEAVDKMDNVIKNKQDKNINNNPLQTELKSNQELKQSNVENQKNENQESLVEETKPSKAQIEAERRRILNQKKQKARAEKLEKLRKEYLIDYSKQSFSSFNEDEIVMPKKRNIDKFVSYEMPAQPILDTLRTEDNSHIPSVLTYKDKVDNLFKSISSNNISYFKSIYNEIGQPNLRNENGDTILTYSLLSQKHDVVASILLNGADPNLANALGYTPLEIVIELADSKSLKLLSDNNVNVNYVDAFKRTYLMHAARVGFLPAVEFLVDKGVDVNAMDEDGFSALAIAYRHKKDIIIKYLLKHGAKPWVEKPYDPSSQLLIKELRDRWKN